MPTALDISGELPLPRVLWDPPPGTATDADLLRKLDGPEKRLVELIDGVLVEKVYGFWKSCAGVAIVYRLMTFVKPRRLGLVAGANCPFRLRPGLVRMPDVSFTSWSRLPADDAHKQPIGDFAPDLAVEVLSPGHTQGEMTRKRKDYFAAGTVLVWEFDRTGRTMTAYTDPATHHVYTAADTLPGDPALPGFTIELAELFADPQVSGRWE